MLRFFTFFKSSKNHNSTNSEHFASSYQHYPQVFPQNSVQKYAQIFDKPQQPIVIIVVFRKKQSNREITILKKMVNKQTCCRKSAQCKCSVEFLHLESFSQNRFGCKSIQFHPGSVTGKILIICLRSDHSSIIAAQRQRGHKNLNSKGFCML